MTNDEQARFEAVYGPEPEQDESGEVWNAWMYAKQSWMNCVAAHQPQGAPVAWFNPDNPNSVINARQYPHVLDKNKVGYLPAFLASAWPPSPCPHLTTSKEGTSYCKLAEDGIERLRKYDELIMAVERKHPNESRHETALRYIRRCETPSSSAAIAAHREKS